MKIGLFGDVHGNRPALGAVLAALAAQGADLLLCTGDLVNYGPEPSAAASLALDAANVCVAGNHDLLAATWTGEPLAPRAGRDMAVETACLRWTVAHLGPAERDDLRRLPPTRIVQADGRRLLLAHGSPDAVDEYVDARTPPARWHELAARAHAQGADVVVLGHTHLPLAREVDGVLFCNPGSVGWPKDGDPRASCAILDPGPVRAQIHRVTYGAAAVAATMRTAGLPEAVAAALAAGRPAIVTPDR